MYKLFYQKLFAILLILVLSGCANPVKDLEVLTVSNLGQGDSQYCWSPDGGYVAFIYNSTLYLTSLDKSIKKVICSQEARHPQWSPDGQEIAFESGGNVWIHQIGIGRSFLVAAGCNPSWHPDSSKILFFKSGSIWIMDRNGSNQKMLKEVGPSSPYPLFSPDGQKICYHTPLYYINIINADGSNHQEFVCYTIDPNWRWSKDSKEILYCDNRGNQQQTLSGVGRVLIEQNKLQIFPIVSPGEVPKIMIISTPHLVGNPGHISSFSYSPDGKAVAISLEREGVVNIYAVDPIRPKHIVQLTNLGGDKPCWSPDGKKILFCQKDQMGVVMLR